MKDKKSIYVYILLMADNRYYTGMTQDLVIRMKQHDKGYSKSTRYYRPLKMIWATVVRDRKTARKLEVKIKNISAKRYLLHQIWKNNRPYKNILNTKYP